MSYYTYIYLISILFSLYGGILVWRQQKNISGFFFLIFSIFSSLWFIIYYLFFSGFFNLELLIYISRFGFSTGIIAVYSLLYYIVYFGEDIPLQWNKKILIPGMLMLSILGVYVGTNLIIDELVFNSIENVYREINGLLYSLHISLHLLCLVLFIFISFKKLKTQDQLNKIRLKNILFSSVVTLSLLLIFQLILPYFGIWLFEKEIIFFYCGFILYVAYTVRRYYFSNIGYGILRIIVVIIALFLAILITNLAKYYYENIGINSMSYWIGEDNYSIYDTIVTFLLYFIIYKGAYKLILGNYGDQEVSLKIEKLKKTISFVTDFETLNKVINIEISKIFRSTNANIIIYNESDEKKIYPELHKFLSKNILNIFINDSVFIEKNKNYFRKNKIISEIPKNTFLIFGLHNSRNINIGFFIIGTKKFGDFYTQSEINILKEFSFFLEIHLKYIRTYTAMEDLSMNLDKKVDEKTIEYNDLINRQKEFIGIISHEIRSPIGSAIFQSDSIIDDLNSDTIQKEKIKEELTILNKQLVRTGGLISKLFSVQYYDTHTVNLFRENIEFGKFLEYEIELFSHVHSEILFQSEIDKNIGFVAIDKIQIQQVINNLLDNAIKFINDTNPIISISAYKKENNLFICIEDNGKGFEGIEIKDIFDKYSTGNRGTVGLGMGLYLCKKIISMHNGSIEASISPTLGGAMFLIKIPVK